MKKTILITIASIAILIGFVFVAFPGTFTYTTAEMQALFDSVNAKVSSSAGAGDAGKMVTLDAAGEIDSSFGVSGTSIIQSGDVTVGGGDTKTLDFNSGPFRATTDGDTEVDIDIRDDGVDSEHYLAASIDPEHLNIANAETDEYVLSYEADTANFQWINVAGGGDITTVGTCVTGDCTADFIDGTDIADDAIDSEHYTDGSIDAVHLAADVIDETKLADNSVDSEHYNDYSVDRINIVGDIIDGTKIADDVVDSEHYVAASIDNEHLADDAVDSDELAAGSVDAAHMSVNSTDSDQYVDASIDNAHLADNAVGTAEIATDAVTMDAIDVDGRAAMIGGMVVAATGYALTKDANGQEMVRADLLAAVAKIISVV